MNESGGSESIGSKDVLNENPNWPGTDIQGIVHGYDTERLQMWKKSFKIFLDPVVTVIPVNPQESYGPFPCSCHIRGMR